MSNLQERIKLLEQLYRVRARKNLSQFITYTKEDYELKWFHELVCDTLTKLLKDELGYKKVMIFLPPQVGKSTISSRYFPAFALGKNPNLRTAVCSYSSDLASGFNRNVQQIIDSPEYKELFPKTKLNGKNTSTDVNRGALRNSDIFEIVGYKGFLKSVGVGGALTGTSVDLGIIDDPFKDRKEARSPTIRQNVWEWYQDVFTTRLHNDSKQLLLFTRWHEDDLAGRLLKSESEEWYVLAIPALKEATKPLKEAKDIEDPRDIDEALWEEKHSAESIRKKRISSPLTFNSLYQQRPSAAEGNMIKREWFEVIQGLKVDSYRHEIYIDGAYTKNTSNDPTAIMFIVYNNQNEIIIKDSLTVHMELYELLEFFPKYCDEHGFNRSTGKVFIEPKASGQSLKSMLAKQRFNAIYINNKTVSLGKESRVEDSGPSLQAGKVKILKGAWNDSFLDECASFPNGTHDDQVDNLCYATFEHFISNQKRGIRKIN